MECAKGFLSDVVDTFDEAIVTLLVAIDAAYDDDESHDKLKSGKKSILAEKCTVCLNVF